MTLHSDHGNAGDAIASKKNHDRQKTEWASRQWPGHDRHKNMLMTPTVFSAWCIFLKGNE